MRQPGRRQNFEPEADHDPSGQKVGRLERTVTRATVLGWLERTDRREALAVLVGLSVDDGNSEEAFEIRDINWDEAGRARSLGLADGRTIPLRGVAAIIDSPDARLTAAVEAALSPGERATRDRRRELGQKLAALGFVESFASDEDARHVLALAETVFAGAASSYELRQAAYLAITRGERKILCRAGARLFRQLMQSEATARGVIAEDCYWRLVKMLNVAGELQEAAALDGMLWNGQVRGPVNLRLLATTLAAAQLALAEVTHDKGQLRAAHRACRLAWRLAPGDEVTSVVFGAVERAMRRAGIDPDKTGKS